MKFIASLWLALITLFTTIALPIPAMAQSANDGAAVTVTLRLFDENGVPVQLLRWWDRDVDVDCHRITRRSFGTICESSVKVINSESQRLITQLRPFPLPGYITHPRSSVEPGTDLPMNNLVRMLYTPGTVNRIALKTQPAAGDVFVAILEIARLNITADVTLNVTMIRVPRIRVVLDGVQMREDGLEVVARDGLWRQHTHQQIPNEDRWSDPPIVCPDDEEPGEHGEASWRWAHSWTRGYIFVPYGETTFRRSVIPEGAIAVISVNGGAPTQLGDSVNLYADDKAVITITARPIAPVD